MPIYAKKTNQKIIRSTIRIDPDCFVGSKVVKFRASVEKPRAFYLVELIEDDPGEITQAVEQVLQPERAIKHLSEIERDAIFKALAIFAEDKVATAAALGIEETTLCRKLAEYGIPKHPLYLEIHQKTKTGDSVNEAQNEGQDPQTSNLRS